MTNKTDFSSRDLEIARLAAVGVSTRDTPMPCRSRVQNHKYYDPNWGYAGC